MAQATRRTRLLLMASFMAAALLVAAGLAAGREDARRTKEVAGEQKIRQAPALPGAQPISASDRVYTADQSSNTVSVINPKTNEVLGTIPLGDDRLDQVLGPVDETQVNVHGLGFSPDGSRLAVISVTSNAAQVIDPATNRLARETTYVGRAPHEGFISPDGRELWVAVRGEDYVSVISLATGREIDRITTARGASKVVFSPDGRLAYVNHLFTNEVAVIDVAGREVIERIPIPAEAGGSADEMISPDGEELWLGHPARGKTTVIDAKRLEVKAVLDTGPRTNHPNFVSKGQREFAYVTVGGLNQTKVFRRTGGVPRFVTAIDNGGEAPHGIWPSPDNTRVYVALQKSDAVDVIDTDTNRVIKTLRIGQDPQALVYVAGAVPEGGGPKNLSRQGLDRRVETKPVEVPSGRAKATIREVDTLDEVDFTAGGLPANRAFTLFAARGDDAHAIRDVETDASGGVDEALAFVDFFGNFDRLILVPKGERP